MKKRNQLQKKRRAAKNPARPVKRISKPAKKKRTPKLSVAVARLQQELKEEPVAPPAKPAEPRRQSAILPRSFRFTQDDLDRIAQLQKVYSTKHMIDTLRSAMAEAAGVHL